VDNSHYHKIVFVCFHKIFFAMGSTKRKQAGNVGRPRPKKPAKKRNNADPVVTKKGVALRQSVWASVRGSLQKFGLAKPYSYFNLFMELPEMHAKIHALEDFQALLDYDDDYAMKWFQSDAGKRWELPEKFNLSYDQDDKHCKKYKLTKAIYEAEWYDQHHQTYSSLTDVDRAPRYHQFETLRRNYWNRAGRYFRDFWLLNPHLSRKDAYTGAYKLAKISLKSEKDYDKLRVTIVKQAKKAFLIKTIVELKDHLVDTDGITHFEVECETASMDLLKGYLVKKQLEEVNANNALFSFQDWLKSQDANKVEKKDFSFLLKVQPSSNFREQRLQWLFESAQARKIFLSWDKHLAKLAEEERVAKEKEKAHADTALATKKEQETLERKRKKEMKAKEAMDELWSEAPEPVPMSDPVTYNSPSTEWKLHMQDTFRQIRSIVENLCLTHNVAAPSFAGTAARADGISEAMKIVGKAAQMFTDDDLTDTETVNAHMKTWLPGPWRECFQSYMQTFHETLTSNDIDGSSNRHLKTLVGAYMAKQFKPVSSKDQFQVIIDSITSPDSGEDSDGVGEYDDDGGAVVDDREEVVNAMADVEAASDLHDTNASAAVLSSLRGSP